MKFTVYDMSVWVFEMFKFEFALSQPVMYPYLDCSGIHSDLQKNVSFHLLESLPLVDSEACSFPTDLLREPGATCTGITKLHPNLNRVIPACRLLCELVFKLLYMLLVRFETVLEDEDRLNLLVCRALGAT
jgi:hypothetical protein